MTNLDKINGNEIIDFLNKSSDKFKDCSIIFPLIFESQRIFNGRYELRFMIHYNNWGERQPISDNVISIDDKNNIRVSLAEVFDGDDNSYDTLEDVLKNWFPTHNFTDQSEKFDNLIEDVYQRMPDLSINDINLMDDLIKKLTDAKSMMK